MENQYELKLKEFKYKDGCTTEFIDEIRDNKFYVQAQKQRFLLNVAKRKEQEKIELR